MKPIRITNVSNGVYFDIPWPWITKSGLSPNLNDLDASATRGITTGYLYRARIGEFPEYTLRIIEKLTQKELAPFLSIIRNVKVNVTYFEPYQNKYITEEFYIPKPKLTQQSIPKTDEPDKIIYDPFEVTFIGYGSI